MDFSPRTAPYILWSMTGLAFGPAQLMNRFSAYLMMALAILLGGGSLVLLGFFLLVGPVNQIRFRASEARMLWWDGSLCLLFFIQHSGMIRRSFHTWLDQLLSRDLHPALYAIVSGVALAAVVLLWQPSSTIVWEIHGWFRLLPRLIAVLAIAGFIWGIRSLRTFDTFGLAPIKARLRGRPLPASRFMLRGPYLWVRHPLYLFMILLFWSGPEATADRLLFNLLWTAWVVLGSRLEERDLVSVFGGRYRRYQETVPMLVPWRGPAGRRLPTTDPGE